MNTFIGEDNFRAWLEDNGFKIAFNPINPKENQCNWYAYRRSNLPARRCECNNDKEGMQIVVIPSLFTFDPLYKNSVEVTLSGEYDGIWWNFKAYCLDANEVQNWINSVETSLISAWNAISEQVPQKVS